MSQELERVYTINLGKVLLSQSQHRAVRAINMIKEFARHHMKVETIKIEEDLAQQIWAKGIRSPPRKIRVRMTKTPLGHVLVSQYDEEIESEAVPEKEAPKVEGPAEEPATETPKVEGPAEEPATETPKVEGSEVPVAEDKAEDVKEESQNESVEKKPTETDAKEVLEDADVPQKDEPAKEEPKKE